jgi:hypothetical protein
MLAVLRPRISCTAPEDLRVRGRVEEPERAGHDATDRTWEGPGPVTATCLLPSPMLTPTQPGLNKFPLEIWKIIFSLVWQARMRDLQMEIVGYRSVVELLTLSRTIKARRLIQTHSES